MADLPVCGEAVKEPARGPGTVRVITSRAAFLPLHKNLFARQCIPIHKDMKGIAGSYAGSIRACLSGRADWDALARVLVLQTWN